MKHICLALPDGLAEKLKAISQQREMTATAYIRGAVAARIQSDITGQRFCAEGSPCILALMPNYQNLASSAKVLLERGSVLKPGG